MTYVYGEHLIWQRAAVTLARRLQHEGGSIIVGPGELLSPAEFLVEVRREVRAHRRVVEAEVDRLMNTVVHDEDDW